MNTSLFLNTELIIRIIKIQEYNLIRSNRKTYSVEISLDGQLNIKVPKNTSNREIDEILVRHQNWIYNNLKKANQKAERYGIKKLFTFEEIFVFGKKYGIVYLNGSRNKLIIKDGKVIVYLRDKSKKKETIEKELKKMAKEYFTQRLDFFSSTKGVRYNSLKLSSAKKRWGSCSSKKNINLNWKLIMLPEELIDSVILHELAHTRHMDHSIDFYSYLLELNPSFRIHDEQIKDYSFILTY